MPKDKVSSGGSRRSRQKGKVIPFKKKKKNYKKLFLFIFLIVSIVCITLFTPFFNIKTIEVLGNERFKPEEIVNMSGVPTGVNILKVNYFKSKKNIATNQYIENAKISISFPNKVKITVTERTPAAFLDYMGTFLIIDRNGIVLDLQKELGSLKIPSIVGVKYSDYKLGNVLGVKKEDSEKFKTALKCINEILVCNLGNMIDKIDMTNNIRPSVWANNDKLQIILTDEQNIPYNLNFFAKGVLPNLEKEKITQGIVDFAIPNKPSYKPM